MTGVIFNMFSKVPAKNPTALQRLCGIALILGGLAIVLKTTRFLSKYPSWNNTILLTIAALILFIGSSMIVQTLRRAKAVAPQRKRHRHL